jgi:chromosome segregation ATPase
VSTVQQVAILVGVAATLIGAVAAWRKLKPETANIVVTSADKVTDMSLRFASHAAAENDQLVADLNALRGEFEEYRTAMRSELDALSTQLRGAKAENRRLEFENAELREKADRAVALEAEVVELRAEVVNLRAEVENLRNEQS